MYLLPIILDQSLYRSQLELEGSVEYHAEMSRDFSNGSHDKVAKLGRLSAVYRLNTLTLD